MLKVLNRSNACGKLGLFAAVAMAATVCGLFCGGCNTTMEDGYKPKPLNASPEAQRAHYATPFSDEADMANKARGDETGGRRPGAY